MKPIFKCKDGLKRRLLNPVKHSSGFLTKNSSTSIIFFPIYTSFPKSTTKSLQLLNTPKPKIKSVPSHICLTVKTKPKHFTPQLVTYDIYRVGHKHSDIREL